MELVEPPRKRQRGVVGQKVDSRLAWKLGQKRGKNGPTRERERDGKKKEKKKEGRKEGRKEEEHDERQRDGLLERGGKGMEKGPRDISLPRPPTDKVAHLPPRGCFFPFFTSPLSLSL